MKCWCGVREGSREQKMCLLMVQTLSRREGKDWRWATFRSAIDKQNPRNNRKVQQILAQDRRLTLRLIPEELGISKDKVQTIVLDDLGKRKICSRFMPHKLTDEQKATRMETSGDFISMCDQDPLFLENIVTGDETWCYQFDPKSKRQSMAWCWPTFPLPKKVICKNPRSKHCWSPFSTTKASSIRNLFLQIAPLMPHFTR